MADQYPAANISLRSASPQSVVLQTTIDDRPRTIGTVDGESALWMVHPGAIYLHEAQSFFVKDLNLEEHIAYQKHRKRLLHRALRGTEVTILSESAEAVIEPENGVSCHHTGNRLQTLLVHAQNPEKNH
jgi:ATP-dependent helicase YprA (DUF1998 family)